MTPPLTLNLAPNLPVNLNRTPNLIRAFSLLLLFLLPLAGCDSQSTKSARVMVGGDPDHGQYAINYYGCAACHTIPGIHGANALVGPPLTQFGSRTYLAGMLQNTPDNLVRWIQDPPAINPHTAMPNLHVTPTDARDIATYLYTLQ
jgi:cytochrome c